MSEPHDETKTTDAAIIAKYPTEYALGRAEANGDVGMTYDDDPESDRSRAYDLGRNAGPDREPLTVDELRRAISGECPRGGPGHIVEYNSSEFGDGDVWQDAGCSCGISWREVSTLTWVVETNDFSEDGDEVGKGASVNKGEECDRLRAALAALMAGIDTFDVLPPRFFDAAGIGVVTQARAALREVTA